MDSDMSPEDRKHWDGVLQTTAADVDEQLIRGMARFMQLATEGRNPDEVSSKAVDLGMECYLYTAIGRTLTMYFAKCCHLSMEKSDHMAADILQLLRKKLGDQSSPFPDRN